MPHLYPDVAFAPGLKRKKAESYLPCRNMALNIKSEEADALARKLARRTGESLTEAVLNALKERLARTEKARPSDLLRELASIRKRTSRMRVRDPRTPDEILGYDEHGLPR
jgi:antitoxin VapB